MKNALLFAFANSAIPNQILPKLKEEEDFIRQALRFGVKEGNYILEIHSTANLLGISHVLQTYKESLTWFHYSGHSKKHGLIIEDEEINGMGIIQMLKQCKKLKGVVLNGCSTQWQANKLREAGIPLVIATSSSVEDSKATDFSKTFYSSLCMDNTISEAFEEAIGIPLTNGLNEEEIHRGHRPPGKARNTPLWGLLSHNEDALNLKIPFNINLELLRERFHKLIIKDLGEAIFQLGSIAKTGTIFYIEYVKIASGYYRNNPEEYGEKEIVPSFKEKYDINNDILDKLLSLIQKLNEEDINDEKI